MNFILMPYHSTKRYLGSILLEVITKGLKMKQSYYRSQYLLPLAVYVIWNELTIKGKSCFFVCFLLVLLFAKMEQALRRNGDNLFQAVRFLYLFRYLP